MLSIVRRAERPGKPAIVAYTIVLCTTSRSTNTCSTCCFPDLVGHNRAPGAFLVYLVLWAELYRSEQRRAPMSLRRLAENSGLSKSAVQAALRS